MNQKTKHPKGCNGSTGSSLTPYYPTKPKKWKTAWKTMTVAEKRRFMQIYGPISELPTSVETARLINETKVRVFKDHLVRSKLHQESLIIRVSISAREFFNYDHKVYEKSSRYAEGVVPLRTLVAEIGDETMPETDDYGEPIDEGEVKERRIYGARRKIEKGQFDMIRCMVQILHVESRRKTPCHFSAELTYSSLLLAIEDFKSIDTDNIQRFRKYLDEAGDRILKRGPHRRSRRVIFEFEVFSYVEGIKSNDEED